MATADSDRRPSVIAHALDGFTDRPHLEREGSSAESSDLDVDGATHLRPFAKANSIGDRSGNTTAIPSDGSEDDAYIDKGVEAGQARKEHPRRFGQFEQENSLSRGPPSNHPRWYAKRSREAKRAVEG